MCSIMDEVYSTWQSVGGFCSICLTSQTNALRGIDIYVSVIGF